MTHKEKSLLGKRVAFTTLGCKLNFSETSTIARAFVEKGYTRVDFKAEADIYVINSCSVTDSADKKSRSVIKQAEKSNPSAFIIVTGCYAQLKPEEAISIPGVDLVVGSNDKANIVKFLEERVKMPDGKDEIISCGYKEMESFNHAYSFGDRTRSFLKVQDGCNYFCTYCTIPMARGKSRNPSIASLLEEVEQIADSGIKEVILTGVNIGDFGKSSGESFIDLIKALDKVEGISRFRIGSVEPNLLSDEIINFMASSNRIAPHFHIPLQAGSNTVLSLMKRRYNTELFAQRVATIKRLLPHAFIGVDIIAGMSGETDELFKEAYNFVEGLPISQLHVFPYSERADTKAISIDGKVDIHERRERAKKLQQLSNDKLRLFYNENIGRTERVLYEQITENQEIIGWTDNYIKVKSPLENREANSFDTVVISEANIATTLFQK